MLGCAVCFVPLWLLQFERERSRALSKDLLAARERWQATEAERAAAEDSRRWVVRIEAAIDCCVECVTAFKQLSRCLHTSIGRSTVSAVLTSLEKWLFWLPPCRVEEAAAKARAEAARIKEEQRRYQEVRTCLHSRTEYSSLMRQ